MGAGEGSEDERPVHRVALDEFHISVREVTNEDYARFVRDTSYRARYELSSAGYLRSSSRGRSWWAQPGTIVSAGQRVLCVARGRAAA